MLFCRTLKPAHKIFQFLAQIACTIISPNQSTANPLQFSFRYTQKHLKWYKYSKYQQIYSHEHTWTYNFDCYSVIATDVYHSEFHWTAPENPWNKQCQLCRRKSHILHLVTSLLIISTLSSSFSISGSQQQSTVSLPKPVCGQVTQMMDNCFHNTTPQVPTDILYSVKIPETVEEIDSRCR